MLEWNRFKQYIFNLFFRDDIIARIDGLLITQSKTGNFNYDSYMHGLTNGMILIRKSINPHDMAVDFKTAPPKWLMDIDMEHLIADVKQSRYDYWSLIGSK